MKIRNLFLVTLLFVTTSVIATPAKLKQVHTSNGANSERLVFSFDKAITYQSINLHNPERFVIDIKNAKRANSLPRINLQDLPIKSMRYATHNHHDLRIVLDLRSAVKPHVFLMKPQEKYSHRLVVDWPIKSTETATSEEPIIKPKMSIAQRNNLRDVIIVIDPGHGGKDSGAKGYRRTNEKDVVLAISKKLKSLVDKQTGMKAVLTRRDDYYIGLRQRLGFARRAKADLFVAVHADAFMRHDSSGASVFALSARGASSEAARWLAERENFSELGGVDDFSDKSYLVRSVLLDLSQTSTVQASLQLGGEMLKNLSRISRLHSHKVEQARFVVLKSPDIPSVLVETGFISNPREEMNLKSSRYQTQLATALLNGIKNYFWQSPPDGSLIAAARKAQHYKVKSGENLASIAAAFKVNKKFIKQLNYLRSDRVHRGQVLLIPPQTA